MPSPVWIDGTTPLNSVNMTQLQTRDEKGAPSGYVPLDSGSKVPVVYLPDVSGTYQPISQKGQPSGYVGLDSGGGINVNGQIVSQNYISANGSGPNQLLLYSDGRIYFGNAGDTSLYRSGVGILQTDGSFYLRNGGALAVFKASADVNSVFYVAASNGALNWGAGGATAVDTNLYRSSAQNLKTDGSFWAGASIVTGGSLYFGGTALDTVISRPSANVLQTSGPLWVSGSDATRFNAALAVVTGGNPLGVAYPGDAQYRFLMTYNGVMQWSSGSAGIDTNLYRGAAGFLKTDVYFVSGLGMYVGNSADAVDPGYGIKFGLSADVNLYRAGPGVLKTDGTFWANNTLATANPANQIEFGWNSNRLYRHNIITNHNGGDNASNVMSFRIWRTDIASDALPNFTALSLTGMGDGEFNRVVRSGRGAGGTSEVWVGQYGGSAPFAGITFGGDTYLYRNQVGGLRTDGVLYLGGAEVVGAGTGNTADARIWFSANFDTSLYRSAAGSLMTDGQFITGTALYAATEVVARYGSATQVQIGYVGGYPGIYFGSAGDTSFYRPAAGQVKTDGLIVASGGAALAWNSGSSAWEFQVSDSTGQPALSTGMIIWVPGLGARRVKVGDASSAGPGLRALAVDN